MCNSEEEADLILLHNKHIERGKYVVRYPNKTVIADYSDSLNLAKVDVRLYFKRSVVVKNENTSLEFATFERDVIPFSFCMRQESLKFDLEKERDVDVCFFPRILGGGKRKKMKQNPNYVLDKKDIAVVKFNQTIGGAIKENFENVFVGQMGLGGVKGRSVIQIQYFNQMLQSKIVVCCNPPTWEGDYRLWEALGCKCLVFVDEMLTPVKHPLRDEEHVIYYRRDRMDELVDKLKFYLNNDAIRLRIAANGTEYARTYHKPSNRIDEILDEFERLK